MTKDEKSLVLIVDDNQQNIQVLGSIMEESGYDVAVAMSGIDALDFVENELPDIILLDIMMPEMDGYEVCTRLKEMETTADIPVIFLSAKRETEDLVKAFDVGGVDYITKPFQSAELLVRLKTHVDLKRARDEIQTLRGILPICASCKKIRDDNGFWNQVEEYVEQHSHASFSHGVCPDCAKKLYGKYYEE